MSALQRMVFATIAWAAFALAVAGVVLPVLPTTPFLLVALWAGSKVSPKFKWWLLRHRLFGPVLLQWYRHGAIDRKAKFLAVAVMCISWVFLFYKERPVWLLVFLALLFVCVSVFLCSRPNSAKPPR